MSNPVPIVFRSKNFVTDSLQIAKRFRERLLENMATALELLRDRMAELRLLIWEQKGLENRSKINPNEERRKMFRAVDDYPPLDLEYEKSIIFDPLSGEKVE